MKSKYEGCFKPGDKFNLLTVISGDIIMMNEACLKFKCECGTEKIISALYVLRGRTVSCGCRMNRSGKDHPEWRGGKIVSSSKFKHLQRGAESRGLEFSINIQYLENELENQKFKCPFTSIILDKNNMSVDRIDPSKGYVEGNIRWIHKDINVMKNSYSDDYFKSLCQLVCGITLSKILIRNRYRRSKTYIKILDSDGSCHEFESKLSAKNFINSFNKNNYLSGPSRVSWNAISRKRESKGWTMLISHKI